MKKCYWKINMEKWNTDILKLKYNAGEWKTDIRQRRNHFGNTKLIVDH